MHLFGTSGIRGIVNKEITPDSCLAIAKALGTTLAVNSKVSIATDTRVSRDVIKSAITAGLLHCGINVTDFGILPTPALVLLTKELGADTGVMITASHNPPQFNGIKLFNGNSLGYSKSQEEEIENIYFTNQSRAVGWRGSGTLTIEHKAKEKYFQLIKGKIPDRNHALRVVVDSGNGAASGFVSELLREIGYDVVPLNDEPNGLFPNRSPEPQEDTLKDTVAFLREKNADLAICYDGDADRVVFCDKEGFLGYNEMIAFISRLVLKKSPNRKVVTTVETGKLLDLSLADLNAEVIRGKVGDVNVAYLVREHNAAIGVEQVGVYIMPQMGYYSDSIFATLLLLSEIRDAAEIRDLFREWPPLFFDKTKIACSGQSKQKVMERIKKMGPIYQTNDINTLDGLRYEFDDSWLLIRPSGTEPAIRIIAEATSKDKMGRLLTSTARAIQQLIEELERSD